MRVKRSPCPISAEEALAFLSMESEEGAAELFLRASAAREAVFGNRVSACSVVNAKCGGCSEDCAFCAQSKSSSAEIANYPLLPKAKILAAAARAEKDGASRLGIVTSGRSVTPGKDFNVILEAVEELAEGFDIAPCASLGLMNETSLARLKDAGLKRYHHNLETAGSFFGEICGTRNYDDQVRTVESAKNVGLEVCCGGIFGLGESLEQRVELLESIRSLEPVSIPLNFLVPIPGTKLELAEHLTPFECLKIIAVSRLMAPNASIRICGGRELNLRDRQCDVFRAGADALMIGGYLVTAGNPVERDHEMIAAAGMVLTPSV